MLLVAARGDDRNTGDTDTATGATGTASASTGDFLCAREGTFAGPFCQITQGCA